MTPARGLRVLAVDDVAPALDELCRLLWESPAVSGVASAGDPITALRLIQAGPLDAVFLDISMPGMTGLELALAAGQDDRPAGGRVRHRLRGARRVGVRDRCRGLPAQAGAVPSGSPPRWSGYGASPPPPTPPPAPAPVDALAAVPVELAGRTRYVRRDDVRFVEAHGDYVRLHTPTGAHLVRIPISRLEEHWQHAGFSRVHRSYLLAVPAVRELRSDLSGGLLAHTDVGDVPVSRRHARELREHLLEAATRGAFEPVDPRSGRS